MNGTARSVGLGARCAGATIALGYLFGIVPGPLVPMIGGLALMTYGHGLLLDRASRTFGAAGLAIVAGGVGVGALRWGSFGLGAIRGAQQVLGPTVLVGPALASTASWIAAGSAMLGLAVWIAPSRPEGLVHRAAWVAEAAVGALALAWIFWGEAHGGGGTLPVGLEWLLVTAIASGAAVGLALLVRRLGPTRRWIVAGVAGAGVVAAAILIGTVV